MHPGSWYIWVPGAPKSRVCMGPWYIRVPTMPGFRVYLVPGVHRFHGACAQVKCGTPGSSYRVQGVPVS